MAAHFVQLSSPSQSLKCCSLVFESILWAASARELSSSDDTHFGTKGGMDVDTLGCGSPMEVTWKAV